jgi:HlyD family secretion protein
VNEILAFLASLIAIVVPGFGATPVPSWNGYVEAEYVYVAPASPGTIETLHVSEGSVVVPGDVLFTLNDEQYRALAAAADARVTAAEAGLANLTTGSREDEIEVVRASLAKAQADLSLAEDTAERTRNLFAEGLVPQARLDQATATLESARAAVRQLEAELKVAELPARDAQQQQAEANLAAARAEAEKARADLADRTVKARIAGRVERLYFMTGETVAVGMPVVALLPADALKVKFYVAEGERPALALGDTVGVTCDGCATGLTARLSYFASDPQFTPPVIYSREERVRLTFLAEATLEGGAGLLPGQPVTVERVQ